MGNLLSVVSAFQMLGADAAICRQPEELEAADRVVLPGVGAFRDCIQRLRDAGWAEALDDAVRRRGRPALGICLGMQAMARSSEEGGDHNGLGWFDAEVVRLRPAEAGLRVPHVGWNDIRHRPSPLLEGLPGHPDFYFVHSYWMRCADDSDVEATFELGGRFTAAVRRENVFATQFHPEKSQENGLRLLENFLAWKP